MIVFFFVEQLEESGGRIAGDFAAIDIQEEVGALVGHLAQESVRSVVDQDDLVGLETVEQDRIQ
ncbi:hypothetical protein [Bradyrhizobium liaoningense]